MSGQVEVELKLKKLKPAYAGKNNSGNFHRTQFHEQETHMYIKQG